MKPIPVYHYTNGESWNAINNGRGGYIMVDPKTGGYIHSENARGLWPIRRVVSLGNAKLPNKAYDCAIFGLLEPEPEEWIKNSRSPYMWRRLMGDIFMRASFGYREDHKNIMLVKADVLQEDDAFVLDWGQIEFAEESAWGQNACEKYWNSRIPLHEYKNGIHQIPEVAIFKTIPTERLSLMWTKTTDEARKYFGFKRHEL